MFSGGLVATFVFLLRSGLTHDFWDAHFWMLTLWHVLAGVAGASVNIAGGALVAVKFPDDPRKNAAAIAVYFGGGGLGVILSGAALPAPFSHHGHAAWPMSWIVLGVSSLMPVPYRYGRR